MVYRSSYNRGVCGLRKVLFFYSAFTKFPLVSPSLNCSICYIKTSSSKRITVVFFCSQVLWKAYIDFEINLEEYDKTRDLYERLLKRTQHVKVVFFNCFSRNSISAILLNLFYMSRYFQYVLLFEYDCF